MVNVKPSDILFGGFFYFPTESPGCAGEMFNSF